MRFSTVSLWLLICMFPMSVVAEDMGLRFTLGPHYRDFDDVDFENVSFRNASNATKFGGPFGVQGFTTLDLSNVVNPNNPPTVAVPVTADYATFSGGSDDIGTGDSWGPGIGIEMDIIDNVDSVVSFVANFQFYSVQAGDRFAATDGFSTSHTVVSILDQGGNNTTSYTVLPGVPGQSTGPLSSTTNIGVENDFDMELYVLDVGLKASYLAKDPFIFNFAFGPTIHIGDVDTSQRQFATFNDPENPGSTKNYSSESRKSDVDFVVGLYAAIEAQYRINESLSVSTGYRYDYAGQEAGTSHGEIDLETRGGYINFLVDF